MARGRVTEGNTGAWTVPQENGTLGLRILLAAILVCLLALVDRRGDTLFGLTSGQILDYISWDCTP